MRTLFLSHTHTHSITDIILILYTHTHHNLDITYTPYTHTPTHFISLTSAASSSLEQLKTRTTAGLQGALQDRKQLELDINIHSPCIVIPEKGYYSELVVN